MRRKDREITDKSEIISIIDKCQVCRLALSCDNKPYVVPMNYGYDYSEEKLVIYFHGANNGMKLDIIKNNPYVCFEIDTSHKLIEGNTAPAYTMLYESVIATGKVSFCTIKEEKSFALKKIMDKYAKGKGFDTFDDNVINAVTIFKLDVEHLTGKKNMF